MRVVVTWTVKVVKRRAKTKAQEKSAIKKVSAMRKFVKRKVLSRRASNRVLKGSLKKKGPSRRMKMKARRRRANKKVKRVKTPKPLLTPRVASFRIILPRENRRRKNKRIHRLQRFCHRIIRVKMLQTRQTA